MSERTIPHGLMPDWAIREYVKIVPFSECEPRPGKISYGVSSYGYDLRLGHVCKIFDPIKAEGLVVDPKKITDGSFTTVEGDCFTIPPNHYALGEAMERMEVPDDVLVIAVGKSTNCRAGIIVNVSPAEPGWRGKLTLEISNATPLPVKLYASEGICQLIFIRAEAKCEKTYGQKNGVYQDQPGLTHARVRGMDRSES